MLKWVGLFLFVATMVASGCTRQASQQGSANRADAPSTVPPTRSQQPITREKAIEMASSKVDTSTLEVKAASLEEKSPMNGKELTVWRVEFQSKGQKQPQVTYLVDAFTAEVVWTENPAGQGAVKFIGAEQALAIAKGVDSAVTWDARFDVDFKYEFNGQERQRPAWVVQALSPAPNTTLWIDAQTSEILVVRQTEAPAPSAGK